MRRGRGFWIRLLVLVAGLVLLARLLAGYPWHATADALLRADPLLLALAVPVNLLSLVLKGAAWSILLRPLGRHRWVNAQEATLLGCAVNSLSFSVIGDVSRINFLSRRDGVSFEAGATAVVWTRVAEAAALGIVLILSLPFVRVPPLVGMAMVGMALVCFAAIAVAWIGRSRPLPRRTPAWLRPWARSLATIGSPRHLFWPLVLVLGNWIVEWLTFHLALLAVHAPVTPGASLAALLASNLTWALRVVPSNLGVFQLSVVMALLPFGIPAPDGVTAGLLLQAVQVLPVLILAGLVFGTRGLRAVFASGGKATPATPEDEAGDGGGGVSGIAASGGGGA